MPRQSSSRSRSSSPTSRGTAARTAPPQQQNNQLARSGLGAGLMGSVMSGMAFGAGAEMMRQLFRSTSAGGLLMPLLLSGASAFGVSRVIKQQGPMRGVAIGATFFTTFIITKKMFDDGGNDNNPYH